MKTNYDIKKIEIEEFKKKLINYFKKPHYDVTLNDLIEYMKLKEDEINLLQYCLDELVDEDWLKKSSCLDHFEYDLTEEHGGIH
ncbi:hypothetical protein HYT25_04190 [Candidatus Pacearchaeota archaeon]|nr:hypothetical protein [Candidatus Pacearchaeota archaeon]